MGRDPRWVHAPRRGVIRRGLLTALLAVLILPAASAFAQIAFVRNLGTASGTTTSSIDITTTGAVTAGNSIIVSVAYNNWDEYPLPGRVLRCGRQHVREQCYGR